MMKTNKSIIVAYRVFPVNFSDSYYHKDFTKFVSADKKEEPQFIYNPNAGNYPFFEKDELNKRGSISRGISFGNNQDAIVNSSLNLQLSGKLSNNINILAAISDNNIPVQPDGNTQQIQDFDKVFITIFNETMKLTVGDFEISKPAGYFLNFNKKAKGANFSSVFKTGEKKDYILKTTFCGAISKGKYNRMVLIGQEGNQGPYKLSGIDNETNIIILAGTEKVYIDGKLMKRGEENDYIIDYNTAEVTFTPQQPVTKDKRLVVEFQYSEQSYARFLIFESNEFDTKRTKTWLNFYSEQDSKNQPLQQSLTDDQKKLLSQIGDSINKAYVPNVDSVAFDNSYVLYRKIDTTLSNGMIVKNIYVYSTNPLNAFYRLGFSLVGINKGNYVQSQTSANGRTFEWVAPVNNVPQGSYEPVVMLVTPKKNQMITVGNTSSLTNTTISNFEFALSNNDVNTFSTIGKGNDVGYAFKIGIVQKFPFADTNLTKLLTSVNYQLINKNFVPIERFRTVEFERDWNLTNSNELNNAENYLNFNILFNRQKLADAKYAFEILDKPNYEGTKNNISLSLNRYGFNLVFGGSILNSTDNLNKTDFIRDNATLSRKISFVTIGIKEEQESNKWYGIKNDSLLNNSYLFNQYEIFAHTNDTLKTNLFCDYKTRKDYLPFREGCPIPL